MRRVCSCLGREGPAAAGGRGLRCWGLPSPPGSPELPLPGPAPWMAVTGTMPRWSPGAERDPRGEGQLLLSWGEQAGVGLCAASQLRGLCSVLLPRLRDSPGALPGPVAVPNRSCSPAHGAQHSPGSDNTKRRPPVPRGSTPSSLLAVPAQRLGHGYFFPDPIREAGAQPLAPRVPQLRQDGALSTSRRDGWGHSTLTRPPHGRGDGCASGGHPPVPLG